MKRTLKIATLFCLLLGSWIGYHSIDEAPRYENILLSGPANIPDDANGYVIASHIDVQALIQHSNWMRSAVLDRERDRKKLDGLLIQYPDFMEKIILVTAKPHFNSPDETNPYTFISRVEFVISWRLLLLKSLSEIENGNIDEAIKTVDATLQFCEKLRLDEHSELLSYLLGATCISEAIDIYHEISSTLSISKKQFFAMRNSIGSIKRIELDNFDLVIKRQFTSTHKTLHLMQAWPLREKLKNYNVFLSKQRNKLTRHHTADIIFSYLAMILPEYYQPINKQLNAAQKNYSTAIEKSKGYCTKISPLIQKKAENSHRKNFIDLLYPEKAYKSPYLIIDWDFYFVRRCQFYNHLSSVMASISILQYKKDSGHIPERLGLLFPDYLSDAVIDHFTGKALHYSPHKKILYSEGINQTDHGGDKKGFYKKWCSSEVPHQDKCESKPTFPINWNDYKFYEAQHKAEAGEVGGQNDLGWMYLWGHYTKPDIEKAIYWFEKAAAQKSGYAMYQLGGIYAITDSNSDSPGSSKKIQDDAKAMDWFKKAYENKHPYGSFRYAENLIEGKGGTPDIEKSAAIFMGFAAQGTKTPEYASSWSYTINDLLEGVSNEALIAAWRDYWLKQPALAAEFDSKDKMGDATLNSKQGDYFLDLARYEDDTENAERFLKKAEAHASRAENSVLVQSIQDYRKQLLKHDERSASGEIAEYVCKNRLHGETDLDLFNQTQKQIFANPEGAQKIARKHHQTTLKKYTVSQIGVEMNDTLDLSFESIPLSSVIHLINDFFYYKNSYSHISVDKSMDEIRVYMVVHDKPAAQTLNMFMASFGVGTRCENGTVHFFIADSKRANTHFFTTEFVTQWDNHLYNGKTLSGTGYISFENNLHYRGEIANALPNGTGSYFEDADKESSSYFRGDHFVGGILYGHGMRVIDKQAVEEGLFDAFMPSQPHNIGYGFGGCMVTQNIQNGTSTETHYDCSKYTPYPYYIPLHPDLPKTWSYTGEYRDGQKTTGSCTLYGRNLEANSFHCEFYNNNLIKVGDVSLLPPGMTITDLKQFHP